MTPLQPYFYIIIFMIIFMVIFYSDRVSRIAAGRRIAARKKNKEDRAMFELAKRFIDKECIIYTLSAQFSGTIKEVNETALLLDNGKDLEAVNLEYVVRIREYPRGKSGKKKSVVLD